MKIAVRADATPQIGLGHLMRSMTLARALVLKGAEVTLVGRIEPPGLAEGIIPASVRFIDLGSPPAGQAQDAAMTRSRLSGMPNWIVVDHYGLDATWEKDMRAGGVRCLVIDDLPGRTHACDLLLDQNLRTGASETPLPYGPDATTLLLGPEYALLRPQFGELRDAAISDRALRVPKHMFVCLGGGEVGAETCAVLEALRRDRARWPFVTVVVGASSSQQDQIIASLKAFETGQLHIQTKEVAALMAKADCAITASGSITWEKCCLGLPGIGISLADNQDDIARALAHAGAQITTTIDQIPEALLGLVPATLRVMAERAAAICDGLGADRVAERMLAH